MPVMVVNAKSKSETAPKTGPAGPKFRYSAVCTYGIPDSSSDADAPEHRHMSAVAEHMSSVSMKTESICASPCLTGWLTQAAAAAWGAEPIPASSGDREAVGRADGGARHV